MQPISLYLKKDVFIVAAFLLFTAAVFVVSNGLQIAHKGPTGIHTWRQADGASYTLNYYQHHLNFWQPAVHIQAGTDGRVASEFPLVYYLSAKLYEVFGRHHYFIRALHFLLFAMGCVAALCSGLMLFSRKWPALIVPVTMLLSPYLFYYGFNFLPDVPAFSLTLTGLAVLLWYFKRRAAVLLYVAMAFFALGALLKISAAILWVAVVCSFVTNAQMRSQKYFTKGHIKHFIMATMLALAVNVAWLIYLYRYNQINGNHYNLYGIIPIWQLSAKEAAGVFVTMCRNWGFAVLSPLYWVAFIAALYLSTKNLRRFNSVALHIGIWCLLGVAAYSLLWCQAFNEHDYYLVPQFIAIVVVFAGTAQVLNSSPQNPKVALWLFGALTLFSTYFLHREITRRYRLHFINTGYYTIEPYLRSIGIKPNDMILAPSDLSPNITLYYCNQPGYNKSSSWFLTGLEEFKRHNIKYVVTDEPPTTLKPAVQQALGPVVGEYNGIKIYAVK